MGSRTVDRIVGITLGIALGVAIVVVFVFFGSEGTIDSPRVSGSHPGGQPASPARVRTTPSPGP